MKNPLSLSSNSSYCFSLKLDSVYVLAVLTACCFLFVQNAYAYNAQVIITNGTGHCTPQPSCYTPYEVDITQGDTVTWLNNDNETHTATSGTTNYGPVGVFDTGPILPGHSYTQFFGSVGRYQYIDKADGWASGIIVVSTKPITHAELGWVTNSLVMTPNNVTNGIIISKNVENSGGTDAKSILFSLKIKNQTGFILFNQGAKFDIPAKQTIPIKFLWNNPPNGTYQLMFETNAANTIGDMNANNDVSFDLISIPNKPNVVTNPIVQQNFTLQGETKTNAVPEFGVFSYLMLCISVGTIIVVSKYGTNRLSF